MIFVFTLMSCNQSPETNIRAQLVRKSLDLRGIRPTIEELEQVNTIQKLEDTTETFLYSEHWGRRVREQFSELYHTEFDQFSISASTAGLDSHWDYRISLGQEPLRIVQRIAEEDLPWTEIVLSDWTMITETSKQFLMVEALSEPNDDGWMVGQYTDGRPSAGVLATTGLWMRYTTTLSNANRNRANVVSRLILCQDHLQKPIVFDRELDLIDQEQVSAAVQNDQACIGCHSSLDPLAAHLFGFWPANINVPLEMFVYHPDRELLYDRYLETQPAYFGTPTSGLVDLPHFLASDPRFVECAVEQVMGFLFKREALSVDQLAVHREAFIEGGLTLRSLYRSVLSDPLYQYGVVNEGGVDAKILSVDQLSSAIEELTGFVWVNDEIPLLKTSVFGLRSLAGGEDGLEQLKSVDIPNPTLFLVQSRLAELAATYALESEMLLDEAERTLYTQIDPYVDRADTDVGRKQLQRWYAQVLSLDVETHGSEIEASLKLWAELYAIEQRSEMAWTGVLISLFRDPLFLMY